VTPEQKADLIEEDEAVIDEVMAEELDEA